MRNLATDAATKRKRERKVVCIKDLDLLLGNPCRVKNTRVIIQILLDLKALTG